MTSTSRYNTTLSYDALDRLKQVSGSTVTRFQYDGQQIIAEYDSSGALQRRFVPGPGLDQPLVWFETNATTSSNARWLLANAFGSIVAVANTGTSNTTIGINHYDEYGVSPSPDTNIGRFQYKGMPLIPEAGMYYARARFYSQYLGRFMQTDPSGYVDGMNLYAFVHNSPVSSSDPLGRTSECRDVKGGGSCEVEVPRPSDDPDPSFPPDFPDNFPPYGQPEPRKGGGEGGLGRVRCMT